MTLFFKKETVNYFVSHKKAEPQSRFLVINQISCCNMVSQVKFHYQKTYQFCQSTVPFSGLVRSKLI